MKKEMLAREQNSTWDLAAIPHGKKAVGYRLVYIVKLNPNGSLACLMTCLVVKGYSQVHGLDY